MCQNHTGIATCFSQTLAHPKLLSPKITLHYEFLEESILFGFEMNREVFDILNYCILNGKFYIHKQKLFHDFYDYLWELKYKLQIERIIYNGTSNDEQFSQFLFIYNAL